MLVIPLLWTSLLGSTSAAALKPRVQDGLAKTPPMGWNTYNHYSCSPNETIVHSNAKALVDLGLADLGYRYVTIDCGWTVPDRLANGSLTWNATTFPSGFPALGEYIHSLGLLFGVYEDSGIKTCTTSIEQAGSLYHEAEDAALFASWKIDALKYDNCFADAATGYPNNQYTPSRSPRPRFANMTNALNAQSRPVLFQICEWGIDFPALWAPSLGHTWRIGNDIVPAWRSIFRTLNQAVPQTSFAGPGQWPDLDMLEVGNNILTTAEEQTHFSMWAILKSPLVIGGALKDPLTSMNQASLSILSNKQVIGFNQDSLGKSASLHRRWSEEGYEAWSGPLSGRRTVVALINWADKKRSLTLNLPDVGVQFAGRVEDVWKNQTFDNVKTSYTSEVDAHGIMLLELSNTTAAGSYPAPSFATQDGNTFAFSSIYANTTSANHTLSLHFSETASTDTNITIQSPAYGATKSIRVPASSQSASSSIALTAGAANEITIKTSLPLDSISVGSPQGTYFPSTQFSLNGASLTKCGSGGCTPVGSKVSSLNKTKTAKVTIPATISSPDGNSNTTSKYLELDYTNNDVAIATSWGLGSNSRNITLALNGANPLRLEVPLSGRHSELFSLGQGWWDADTLGVLVPGWKNGGNELVIGNDAADDAFQANGADFVGLRVYD